VAGSRARSRVEFRFRHASGHYVWLETTGSPLLEGDRVAGAILVSRDITERKHAEQQLQHRLALEEAVTQVATELVAGKTPDLKRILEVLGGVLDADRAFIFQFREGIEGKKPGFEWSMTGDRRMSGTIESIDIAEVPWWSRALRDAGSLRLSDVSELPLEAANEKGILESRGIRSLLAVPVFCSGELLGVMGFGSTAGPRDWPEGDAHLLRVVSEMLAAYVQRKHSEDALRESEERYRTLIENQDEGIGILDLEENFMFANPAADAIFGVSPGGLAGRNLREFVDSENFEIILTNTRMRPTGIKTTYEIEVYRPSGEKRVLLLTGAPRFDSRRVLIGTFGIFRDITEQKQAEAEIKYLSFHDKLTGLYNRAYFEEELMRINAQRQLPISIIMGDVNGLKLVNDAFGHHEGDRHLVEMAHILRGCCRKEDVVARWGGDEFVMVLPKTSHRTATEVCDRIRQACRESARNPLKLSIALGTATKETPGESIQELLREAEDRMYRNKLLESKSTRSFIFLSLQKTLRERSHETEEHAQRLQKIALRIGQALGLSDSKLDELSLLAALHDIGKIAIPDSILLKPTQLTAEEWETVKRHPEIGYRIAASSPEMAPIAEAILSHHERWDGTGYPQGLKGDEIPLTSRIIAVADAYDTMTHRRQYKEAIRGDEACREISANAGTQFDPEVVRAFLGVVPELQDA
ncbi:MAG: diguanylate cyclase, partial [Firmicutes bacterium]|nr:diguanylate cyclase [Bacillota bacterium]